MQKRQGPYIVFVFFLLAASFLSFHSTPKYYVAPETSTCCKKPATECVPAEPKKKSSIPSMENVVSPLI